MNTKSTKKVRSLTALLLVVFIVASAPIAGLADGDKFKDPAGFTSWQVVGPSGGDVRVVTIDPKDKDRLYISTMDGQIYTSGDGGKSWTLLANLEQPRLVLDQLFVDSQDSNVIYASGHRGKFAGGFFKSKDRGVTWKEAKELRGEAIHAMAQAKDNAGMLFVGTTSGVWQSKNSGDDWEKIESTSMPINVNSMAIDPRRSSTIYAGTWWRPYKSTDGGKNWRLIKDGMIDDSDIFAVTIDFRNAEHIVASACSGIYESFNGGDNWKKIQGIPSQSRRTRDIVQHPTIPGTVYAATTEGFWMTSNGGKSWALTTQRNLEINSIAVHPDDPQRVFIATNNYGVMVSYDGGKNFAPTNENFTSRFTYSVTPDIAQPHRLYATTRNTASSGGFVFFSDNSGTTWTQAKGLDVNRVSPFTVLQDRVDPNRMLLGTSIGVFRSLDRGVSWTRIEPPKPKVVRKVVPTAKGKATAATKKPAATAPLPTPSPEPAPLNLPALTDNVKVLAFTDDGKNGIFAGTDTGLYRTYDIDKGWEKLPFGTDLSESVFVIQTSSQLPGTIWIGTATSGVIVSRDDGKTWSRADGVPQGVPISSIAIDQKRPNNIYVGSVQALYVSRDGGRTWNFGRGLPLGNFTSILIDPNNPDEIFMASALESDGGIFYSDDAGMKWRRVDSKGMKVPSRRVWTMAFDPSDPKTIFAGSHSSGVYRIERQAESAAKNGKPENKATGNGN